MDWTFPSFKRLEYQYSIDITFSVLFSQFVLDEIVEFIFLLQS